MGSNNNQFTKRELEILLLRHLTQVC